MTVLLWVRQCLRVSDNPALAEAVATGEPVVPVYIWAPDEEAPWAPGGASKWWLHRSLDSLSAAYKRMGSWLTLCMPEPGQSVPELIVSLMQQTGARTLVYDERYEPAAVTQQQAVEAAVRAAFAPAASVHCINTNLLFHPETLKSGKGTPFKVFTPYWKAAQQTFPPGPMLHAPTSLPAPQTWPHGVPLRTLGLDPTIDWACGLAEDWQPGEIGAQTTLERFYQSAVTTYETDRDRPDRQGTSRLSPYLHFGEVSPRQVWHAIHGAAPAGTGATSYLRELAWREFAYQLLYHFPHTAEACLRPEFNSFPWLNDPQALKAWQKGRTGYPIVDAGMRQLWVTGWMHNRVRMIVGSFLVKHLQLPWLEGAKWFWDTLVDADLANNTLGWQWVAGCGADAAPYFRVFNPTLQGEKFDPQGAYVRHWIPQLASTPATWIHHPWDAPALMRPAGYPPPIVDHKAARERALTAFASLKQTNPSA
jgi:deoxyribodipyrimidine photo-lyase